MRSKVEPLAEVAEKTDDDDNSYVQFGKYLEFGTDKESMNHTTIVEFLKWHASKPGDAQIDLQKYIAYMKEGRDDIYYVTGERTAAASSLPSSEAPRKKGLEVCTWPDRRMKIMPRSSGSSTASDPGRTSRTTTRRKIWRSRGPSSCRSSSGPPAPF